MVLSFVGVNVILVQGLVVGPVSKHIPTRKVLLFCLACVELTAAVTSCCAAECNPPPTCRSVPV